MASTTVAEDSTTPEVTATTAFPTTAVPAAVPFDPEIVGSNISWERGSFPDEATGGPFIAPGAPDELLELGDRQLVLGSIQIGAAFWGLASWFKDDQTGWRQVNLEPEFDFPPEFAAPLGSGPTDFASNGEMAVAVGSIATSTDDGLSNDFLPTVWTSTDLLNWELIEFQGAGTVFRVVATVDGWAALANIDGQIRLYVSQDARSWQETFAVDTPSPWHGAFLARAGDQLIIDQLNDEQYVSDDSGRSWHYMGQSDESTRMIALHGDDQVAVTISPTEIRWSDDGQAWDTLGAGTTASLAERFTDLVGSISSATRIVGENGLAELWLVTHEGVWIGTESTPWQQLDLSQLRVTNAWGGSWLTDINVLADGTLIMLGAVESEPGNKPMSQATFWIGRTSTEP